jgi:hypothetical protein
VGRERDLGPAAGVTGPATSRRTCYACKRVRRVWRIVERPAGVYCLPCIDAIKAGPLRGRTVTLEPT